MKMSLKRAALILAAALLSSFCLSAAKKEIKTVTFHTNLDCKNCAKKVTENISFEKGVKTLDVSLEKQTITVGFDATKNSTEKLAHSIEKLGYSAIEHVEGKCPVCDAGCNGDCSKCKHCDGEHGHEHHDGCSDCK